MSGQVKTLDMQKLNRIKARHARWAGSLGLGTVFVPLSDTVVVGAVWTSLLVRIAEEAGHPVDKRYAQKFAGALVKGTLLYLGGSRLATWVLSMTGVGAPGAMATNAALNYGYTLLLGNYLIQQFSQPNVDLAGMARSAAAFLLSFGLTEVAHLHDLHEAATTAADVHQAVSSGADAHPTVATIGTVSEGTSSVVTEPVTAHHHAIKFGSGTCYHCGGRGYTTWPSSGTTESCWYCSGSGVAS